jgi:SpoVK/Ycf46/Vps4 family AAA+-type ATPase
LSSVHDLLIQGIPEDVSERIAARYRSRYLSLTSDFLNETRLQEVAITVGTSNQIKRINNSISSGSEGLHRGDSDEVPIEIRAQQYKPQLPLYTFEQLIVPEGLMDELLSAVDVLRVEQKVFYEWGLKKIEPFPRSCLNFHGEPGTGKTLAAHAIANSLQRPILVASYAEIESKFHGDGPKNVKAIFYAAERDRAVLFIDEADSLLSHRLTEVTQGSEQAINSMRSQLLICLESFRGIVIFATNLVENYDRAFETRVRHLYFPMPDEPARRAIWRMHLVPELPLAPNVSVEYLAQQVDNVCGRDIKNAVIDAAVRAARYDKPVVDLNDLLQAIDRIKTARALLRTRQTNELTPEEEQAFANTVKNTLSNGQNVSTQQT